MEQTMADLIGQMTREEKISLLTGADLTYTRGVPRLGIAPLKLSDGPHGVRAQTKEDANHMGLGASAPATCFPTGAALASSWDRDLLAQVGRAVGLEARALGIQVIFGPAFNLKRSPLCGRSFEYYSEDPLLSGELAASFVRAVQAVGVAACPKHLACNNQEDYRLVSDSVVDMRTLRELYLSAFERVVRTAAPWCIMNAYNKLNGTYCAEDRWLLTQVLREEWGFDGVVISDFGSVSRREVSAAAGLDLEMPGTFGYSDQRLRQALEAGQLTEQELDACVARILQLIGRTSPAGPAPEAPDLEAHHRLARAAAAECMVLLKNDGGLLPLEKKGSIAVIGALARSPRYQGGGSSHVASYRVENAWDELRRSAPQARFTYAPGYDRADGKRVEPSLVEEAAACAAQADRVLLFIGLTEDFEAEGQDRTDLSLPPAHLALADAVLAANPNTAVILTAGAPVELPWLDRAPALLDTYTAGDGIGGAVADLVFGDAVPSGKLAETFPLRLCHTPACTCGFHGSSTSIRYGEGVFVGYRYYEYADRPVAFPFGHGLSYTAFRYSALALSAQQIRPEDGLTVSLTMGNTGACAGAEVVQLYVAPEHSSVPRPVKELRAFRRIFLEPGEEKQISFSLGRRDLARYDPERGEWVVEPGIYQILVGASSADIRLAGAVRVEAPGWDRLTHVTMDTTLGRLASDRRTLPILRELMAASPMYDPDTCRDPFLTQLPLRTANHMAGRPLTVEELADYAVRMDEAVRTGAGC